MLPTMSGFRTTTLVSILAAAALPVGASAQSTAASQPETAAPPAGTNDSALRRIDPTDFRSRLDIRDEYQAVESGGYRNVFVLRGDWAVTPTFQLRADVPFVSQDLKQAGLVGSGIGNILLRANWRALRGASYAVVVAAEVAFPTITAGLGLERPVFAPVVFASIDVEEIKSVFFPVYQYFTSVGGDGCCEIRVSSIKPVLFTRWPNRVYTVVEPNFLVDHVNHNDSGMTLELEVGRLLNPNLAVYLRPGYGVFGDLPQVYYWNFEVGVRYYFD